MSVRHLDKRALAKKSAAAVSTGCTEHAFSLTEKLLSVSRSLHSTDISWAVFLGANFFSGLIRVYPLKSWAWFRSQVIADGLECRHEVHARSERDILSQSITIRCFHTEVDRLWVSAKVTLQQGSMDCGRPSQKTKYKQKKQQTTNDQKEKNRTLQISLQQILIHHARGYK